MRERADERGPGHDVGDGTPERWLRRFIAITLVAVTVVTAGVVAVAAGRRRAAPDPAAVEVVGRVSMRGFEFGSERYEVPAGRPVGLQVSNGDRVLHTVTVPALDIDRIVRPGASSVVVVDAPPGTYAMYCRPHADLDEPDPAEAGMAAWLVAS